jgi:acetyltransferase-like isoleucine patch superfamily enzyme
MKPLALRAIRLAGRVWCRFHGAQVHSTALIHGFPRVVRKSGATIRIGAGVTINAACWANAHNDGRRTVLFAGPSALIELCDNAGLSSSRIIAYEKIVVGESSLIGAGSLICDSDMHEIPLGSKNPVRISPISIGKSVFIGANTTILKGAVIGDGAVIGASSVVSGVIAPGVIAAGNPARPIKNRS